MTRMLLFSSVLGLSLVTALTPVPTQAAETIHFSQNDMSAWAIFSGVDPSGCILTEVFVVALDGRRKDGQGPGAARSEANIAVSQYDSCTDTLLLAAEGAAALSPEAFQIDDLDSAALNTAIELFDSISGSSFVVDVALTWEGVGEPLRLRDHIHIVTRAFSINFRFDGTDRPAAAAGTVSDETTNFTPEPGVDNSLRAIRSGQVAVQRN
jgi:hypothetical protein